MKVNIGAPVIGGEMLLTIAFVVLKVLGYIDWKWMWVFAPLWIGASIVVLILIIIGIIMLVWK